MSDAGRAIHAARLREVAMNEAGSPVMDARSRKTLALLLQGISRTGQSRIAEALGVSDATVSRMKDDLPRFALLLTAIGVKPVGVDARAYSAQYIESLAFFAKRGMDNKVPEDDGDDIIWPTPPPLP